jgi:hypothetical protein
VSGCCARHGQEELFGAKMAARDARKYRRKGPDAIARSLARRSGARGVEGATVLEIGGGEVIELVPDYEPYVRELASEAGVADRVAFRTADLVADPAAGRPADIVVLNKVVCCTPDGVELAGIAASLARRTLAISYPRRSWWVRAFARAANVYFSARRRRFRVYAHLPQALHAAVEAHGLARVSERDGPVFRVVAFERT